jgi:hypothetical protein
MTFQRLANRLRGLEQTATTLDRMVTLAANTSEIPGLEHTRAVPRASVILEADKLQRLGTAARRTWFGRDDGSEIRVDVEVPQVVLNDSLPPTRVLLQRREHVPERRIDEGDPAKPWQKGNRRVVRGHYQDRYWRCTLMPAGSFAAALERDAAKSLRPPSSAPREPSLPVKVGAANAQAVEFWDDLRAGRTPEWRDQR